MLAADMFEPRSNPLLAWPVFYARVARRLVLAFAIELVSLGIGMAGYHVLDTGYGQLVNKFR
jgi:hypothetical protein